MSGWPNGKEVAFGGLRQRLRVVESCQALLAFERTECGQQFVVLVKAVNASWLEGKDAAVQGGCGLEGGTRVSSP